MKLLLSGEGKSDMGQNIPGGKGVEFQPGPMAWIVDRLLQSRLAYSLIESARQGSECVQLVSEADLGKAARKDSMLLPGARYGKNIFFTRNAALLGQRANAWRQETQSPVIAVLFRDGDGTRATPPAEWLQKRESIRRGFALAECETGVAMVPRPKSEAWLLCARRSPEYAHCAALEDAPGNDASPNSLKKQLAAAVGHEADASAQAEWVESGRIDPARIDMPSFNAFRDDLWQATDKVTGRMSG